MPFFPRVYSCFNHLKHLRSGPELRGRYILKPTIHRRKNQAPGPSRFGAVNLECDRKWVSEMLISQSGASRSGSKLQGTPSLASPCYPKNFSPQDACVWELWNFHYLKHLRWSRVFRPRPRGLKFGEQIQPGAPCQPPNFQPGATLRLVLTARRKRQKVEISTLDYAATSRAIGLKLAGLIHLRDLFQHARFQLRGMLRCGVVNFPCLHCFSADRTTWVYLPAAGLSQSGQGP